MLRRSRRVAVVLCATALVAGVAGAETSWVKDELTLNLRTGPGNQYRIKGIIKTGESVQVVNRREGWTEVRSTRLGNGWVPEGFLQPEPPAGLRLAQTEAETAEFRSQYSSLTERVDQLEKQNAELSESDGAQRAEIETLTRENLELRAGARWPEWITGAVILGAGMLLGAIVHSVSGRRQRPRIRL